LLVSARRTRAALYRKAGAAQMCGANFKNANDYRSRRIVEVGGRLQNPAKRSRDSVAPRLFV